MKASVNYVWRILATGFCFSVFGLGGIVLTCFVFPLQKLLIRNEQARQVRARHTVHIAFKCFVWLMNFLGVIGFHIKDSDKFKALRGQLVLANHPSLIDVVVLISVIPHADCVVKAHLFKNPFMRGVIKGTGYISNASPEGLIDDCERSLRQGNNLIIFPEGTRSQAGCLNEFKRGAANIALRAQAPIFAALITMKPSTLMKGIPWYNVAPIKAHFTLRAAPVQPDSLVSQAQQVAGVSKQARVLTRELQSYFKQQVKNL